MPAKRWNSTKRNKDIRISKLHINAKKMNTPLLEGVPPKRTLLQRMTSLQKIAKDEIEVLQEEILQIKLKEASSSVRLLQLTLRPHNLVISFLMSDLNLL